VLLGCHFLKKRIMDVFLVAFFPSEFLISSIPLIEKLTKVLRI
jgi:hypothetical protein